MGTLGTGIFDDDLAADVRGEYRDLIADGDSGPQATDTMLHAHRNVLTSSEAPTFWLALAATQWECGRLERRVLDEALAVLNRGSDLTRWSNDQKLLNSRRQVLERLRKRLSSPPPHQKRIRRRFRDNCEWEIGEVIAYRLTAGRLVLVRIVQHVTDSLGTYPLCELLDWIGATPPAQDAVRRLPVRRQDWPTDPATDQFTITRATANELPAERVQRLGIKLTPSPVRAVQGSFSWKDLDRSLERRYASLVRGAV